MQRISTRFFVAFSELLKQSATVGTSEIPMGQSLIIMLLFIGLMGCSQNQDSKEALFWRWFQANETRLFDFEKDQDRVFNELQMQLHRIQPSLTFEFGPKEEGKREFVISADGIKDAFPLSLP